MVSRFKHFQDKRPAAIEIINNLYQDKGSKRLNFNLMEGHLKFSVFGSFTAPKIFCV